MKKIILVSGLMILSCISLNAMDPAKIKSMATDYITQKVKVKALLGFPEYYETDWFNTNIIGGGKRIRYAKSYLNYISILLDQLDQTFPGITIDQLPTIKDSKGKDVNLAQQTKSVLATWGLNMQPQKDPTDPSGKRVVWVIVGAQGPAAPSSAEVTALKGEIANLRAQLTAATGPAPATLDAALKDAETAAANVRKAYTDYTGADKANLAKPGIQRISTALITPAL